MLFQNALINPACRAETVAEKGLLAPDAWNCKKLQVSLKATMDVPMLGTIIENNGDSLDDSHMPIGWLLLIDGAVRQCCVHRYSTVQDMLQAYDLEKNSVEINRKASQWSHYAVWNRKVHGGQTRQHAQAALGGVRTSHWAEDCPLLRYQGQ